MAAALVVLFGGRWIALRYTQHAWFADAGLGDVYWALQLRHLAWSGGLFLAGTVWYAAHTLAVTASIGSVHLPRRLANLEIAEAVPRRWLRWIAFAMAATLGLATAYSFGDIDHFAGLYRNAVDLGVADPVLRKDATFYLAKLPLLELLHLCALLSVILALLLSGGLYFLTGSITVAGRRVGITPHARTHITILLAVLALVLAWGFQLHAYDIVGGGGDNAGALSAVDRTVRLPAANALALIALVVAVGSGLAIRVVRTPVLLGLWVTLMVSALLGRVVVPLLADAWGAAPPGIGATLAADEDTWSRAGLGLTGVQAIEPPPAPEPGDSLARAGAALAGLSPWSTEPGLLEVALGMATSDTAAALLWSTSLMVAPAAPGAPGAAPGQRLIALGMPQADPVRLSRGDRRPSWSARHRESLAWGGALYAVDARARTGPLRFLESLEPGDSGQSTPRQLQRAPGHIRFLPHAADLAVIGPGEAAAGDSAPGLVLGGFLRRLAFAWALQSPPLLGNSTTAADRVLVWRDVSARLSRLYPFASFEAPRAVIVGGRLLWVSDGYLASPRYPLATHVRWRGEEVSYLAAPFVATVDAVRGTTRLYLRPSSTPFAVSVARGEGIVPLPADSMPRELRERLLYPQALLGAQAAMLARRSGDSMPGRHWLLARGDTTGPLADAGTARPAVALLAIGGVERAWSLLSLTDAAGTRLAAIVAGSTDETGALDLRMLELPREGFPAPATILARLAGAPAALAVAAAAGSAGAMRKGNVVAVPVAGTVVYAQAVFATDARQSEAFEIRALALTAGSRAGIGADFALAAAAAQRGDSGAVGGMAGIGSVAAARAAFLSLDSAARSGDWTRFGRAYEGLRRALGLAEEPRP